MRQIPRFPAYTVDEAGVVRRGDRIIKQQTRNGYPRVRLRGDCGFTHWVPVHTIVLETFVGPRPSLRHHGAHLDGDRANCHPMNLAWKLPEENEADKKVHGTAPRGGHRRSSHPARVRAILRHVRCGVSYSQIARRFKMHRHSVSRIARGLRRAAL